MAGPLDLMMADLADTDLSPDVAPNPASRPDAPAVALQGATKEAAPEKRGPLLDEPNEQKVFKAIDDEWKRTDRVAKNAFERAKRNRWWREGKRFARLIEKREDQGLLKAELPPGLSSAPPIPNKVDDLCRKVTAQVTVDPPAPDVEPETDSDEDRAAAEFSTRWLKADGMESGTDDAELLTSAVDLGMTHASAYAHVFIDPVGGGWRPRQIKAHPRAVDTANPLVDPQTGMPTTDYILRYVTVEGQITDNALEAEKQWLPKIERELLPPENVRMFPDTAASVKYAEAVTLCMAVPLSKLRDRYEMPEEPWSDDQVGLMLAWRPLRHKDLVPRLLVEQIEKAQQNHEKRARGENIPPDALCYVYIHYRKSVPLYPEGAMVVVSGADGGTVLHRDVQSAVVTQADETEKTECLEIPVAQCRQLNDTMNRNPLGIALIEKFGPADESRASIIGGWHELLDQLLHRNLFLPITSPLQPQQLALRDGTPLPITAPEDKPTYEDVPDFPQSGVEMLDRITDEMNNASGLQQSAQGVASPSVQSGIHAREIIEQSLVALGEVVGNALNFMRRYWRLKTQLARARMTVPQLVGYVGDDGAYKQEWWTGADFAGTRDVAIAKGSGTMMAPTAKQQWLGSLQQAGWIDPEDAKALVQSGVSGIIGLQDNPHYMRVKRQIASWLDGPPEGWTPAQPAVDPATGQPIVDPATGAPQMGAPSFSPFEARPNDEEPLVAKVRARALTEVMAGTKYEKQPPEWRVLLDAEYTRMAYASGIVTMRQQAEAAQQQQAQAAQQAQSEQQGKQSHEKDMKQSDQAHAKEQSDSQNAVKQQLAAQHQTITQDRPILQGA